MEYRMLTEVRSEEAKRIRKERKDKDYSPRRGKILVPRTDGLVQALQTGLTKDHYVLVTPKLTSTPQQFIKNTFPNIITMETLPLSTQTNSPTLTYSAVDSLVRHLVSQGNEKDLKIPEGHSSLTLREYCEQNNLDCSSLKMLKGFSATTTEKLSEPSSVRLMIWGMTYNGKCLTAKITESHKTGNECSLSDILEEHIDPKYFLSEQMTARLLTYKDTLRTPLLPVITEQKQRERTLRKVNSMHKYDNSTSLLIPTIESTTRGGLSPTLNTMQGGNRQPFVHIPEATKKGYAEATVGQSINLSVPNSKKRRGRVSDIAQTIDTGMQQHTLTSDARIRRLTPTECERLQGFPDGWTEGVSDTQRYKTLGNAVTTNVIQAVMERLI